MMDFWEYVLLPFIMTLLASSVFFVLICILGNEWHRYSCKQYAAITTKETKYSNFDACYVKTENGFQRWDEYTARATANNLKDK